MIDTAAIATLFYDTVHYINSRDYTLEQLSAVDKNPIRLLPDDESRLLPAPKPHMATW